MTIEQFCTSLEISKQLKEAGYPQESLFTWIQCEEPDEFSLEKTEHAIELIKFDGIRDDTGTFHEIFAAPTASELGEQLPNEIIISEKTHWFLTTWKRQSGEIAIKYKANEKPDYCPVKIGKTEANARAKMWIYLKQNNLLEK